MTAETSLHVIAGVFAAYILFRHLPGAWALARGRAKGRPLAAVSAVNVVIALVILGFALKGLLGGPATR